MTFTQIAIIFVISLSITYFFRESAVMLNEPFDYDSTFKAINLIATTFIYGVPFTLGGVIMWNTDKSHRNISERTSHRAIRDLYLERLVFTTLISFLLMLGICIFGFIVFGAEIVHLPAILLSMILVTIMLNIIISLLALFVDSPIHTIIFATAIFSYLSFILGWSPFSASDDFALYSPYHLFRFLAIILIGYDFPSGQFMEYYTGLAVQPLSLVGPLVVWGLLSLISVIGTTNLMQEGVTRWKQETSSWESQAYDIKAPSVLKSIRDVKIRQKMFAAVIVLLFISTATYNIVISSGGNQIPEDLYLYRSPFGGERINLNSWRYGEVEISSTQISQADGWTVDVTIVEWGIYSGSEGLDVKKGLVKLSLEEYAELNDTERNSLISGTWHGFTPDNPTSGEGVVFNLDDAGTYIWAVKVTDSASVNATYMITISINVYLQSI